MWRMVRRCPRTCADVAGLPLQEWNSAIQVPAHSRPGPRVTWAGPRGVRRGLGGLFCTLRGDRVPAPAASPVLRELWLLRTTRGLDRGPVPCAACCRDAATVGSGARASPSAGDGITRQNDDVMTHYVRHPGVLQLPCAVLSHGDGPVSIAGPRVESCAAAARSATAGYGRNHVARVVRP